MIDQPAWFRWIAATLMLVPLFAACASGDAGGEASGETPTASSTAATSSPATRTPTATAANTATPAPTQPQESATSWANRVLALAPEVPDNIDLFTSDYLEQPVYPEAYPEGSPMAPATGPERTPDEVRTALVAFLDGYYSPVEISETLAVFDAPDVVERVPDANIRAGFALLNLTVARPLIGFFLSSDGFVGQMEWAPMGIAFTEAALVTDDGRTSVALNERYRHEHFALLTANIAQTLLHHDGEETFSYAENVITLFISTYAHLQILSKHPELAYLGTELARLMNTFSLALLNAHPAGSPELAQIVPYGLGVLPGSPEDAPDYWTLFDGQIDSSTGPSPLRSILDRMLDDQAVIPANVAYSRATAMLIDDHLDESVLTRPDRVRLSVLLGMITPAEIAALVDAQEREIVAAFDLDGVVKLRTARN